jgi:hypothetical protein
VALAALISAYRDSSDPTAPLCSMLPLVGRTLLERQARVAADAGASRIIILVERLPADLVAAIDRLRAERLDVAVARGVERAAEALDANDDVLLVADGALFDGGHVRQLLDEGARAVLTVPAERHGERFERIDAERRWSGLALIDGALLKETAAILRDWDFQSTVLRRALQSGAVLVDARTSTEFAQSRDDLADLERRLIANAGPAGGGWASRYLLAPVERHAVSWMVAHRFGSAAPAFGAILLALLGAAAFVIGPFWAGLALLVAGAPLRGIAARLARIRIESGGLSRLVDTILPLLHTVSLLALGARLSPTLGWGMALLAVVTLAFLVARAIEAPQERVRGGTWLADGQGLIVLMIPFAVLQQWGAGLALISAYAAASFFWAQREVHRVSRAHQD